LWGSSVHSLVADRADAASLDAVLEDRSFDAVIDAICYTPDHARQDIALFTGRAKRLVMISTDFVYSVQNRPVPVPEDWLRDAPTAYGRNKAACEDILLEGGVKATPQPPVYGGLGGGRWAFAPACGGWGLGNKAASDDILIE